MFVLEISSPNYPNDSGKNQKCSYRVAAPAGSQVGINFLDMDMQRDNLGTCLHDHLLLQDTKTSSFGVIGTNLNKLTAGLVAIASTYYIDA